MLFLELCRRSRGMTLMDVQAATGMDACRLSKIERGQPAQQRAMKLLPPFFGWSWAMLMREIPSEKAIGSLIESSRKKS